MKRQATTPTEYLANIPTEQRKIVKAVRATIKKNLRPGFQEKMQYGMIGWSVPHKLYPHGYHCDPAQPVPFASVAAQKHTVSVYLFCLYTDQKRVDRFVKAWKATGIRLDMGKSCIRIKKLEDANLELIGQAIGEITVDDFLASYDKSIPESVKKKRAKKTSKKPARKKAAKKATAKKKATKKTAAKKIANKKKPTVKKKTKKKVTTKRKVAKKVAKRKTVGRKKKAKKKTTRRAPR